MFKILTDMHLEKRYIGANQAPFLKKTPSKDIMTRSGLGLGTNICNMGLFIIK